MDAVRLHFPEPDTEPLRLTPGTHALGWRDGQFCALTTHAKALITLRVDARDIWLHVAEHTSACVHVNGRQVYRIALLRRGDVVHVDALELRLVTALPPRAPAPFPASDGPLAAPYWVLRSLGGPHHGRCFPLNRPRQVGRSVRADIQLDDPTLAERHLCLQRMQDHVIVHDLNTPSGSFVNGHPVRDAMLMPADQLVLGGGHRFVLEVPHTHRPISPPPERITPPSRPPPPPQRSRGSLWLLLAAVVMASAMVGLLLFGKAA